MAKFDHGDEKMKIGVLAVIVLSALFVRWSVSLGSYSGQGKSPMFGDYEAQRHWMEITINLPPAQWYFNTSNNDLMYWGLDYPPLTAYHSWICGRVAHLINPTWVELNTSRGIESYEHKLFMRYTVLLIDLLVCVPAVIVYCLTTSKFSSRDDVGRKCGLLLSTLLYPGLILIDYGHFQYNCVSLGLFIWAAVFIVHGHELLGSVAYCLALNYKQMELYHAPPFFFYLFGMCVFDRSQYRIWRLSKIAVVVICTFVVCWLPFLHSAESVLQAFRRIFPVSRGLYEDKVANFWCSISVLIKLKNIFSVDSLVILCLVTMSLLLMPSSLDLLLKPTTKRFKLALINSSLVFFLFSFHVHEKSILLAAIPVSIVLNEYPFIASWFLYMTTFSMFPLFVRDGLVVQFFATQGLFFIVILYLHDSHTYTNIRHKYMNCLAFGSGTVVYVMWLSVMGSIVLCICSLYITPPARFPDFFPVIIACYSCAHFIIALVCFHVWQLSANNVELIDAKNECVIKKVINARQKKKSL